MLDYQTSIIESIDDLEIWAYIIAGFDFRGRLLIEHHYINDTFPRESYVRTAIIDRDDVMTISSALHIKPEELPDKIYDYAGSSSTILDVSAVEYSFKEILLYLIEHGAQYKLDVKRID